MSHQEVAFLGLEESCKSKHLLDKKLFSDFPKDLNSAWWGTLPCAFVYTHCNLWCQGYFLCLNSYLGKTEKMGGMSSKWVEKVKSAAGRSRGGAVVRWCLLVNDAEIYLRSNQSSLCHILLLLVVNWWPLVELIALHFQKETSSKSLTSYLPNRAE